MKTFEDLKQKTTPEIIKWMCKIADGFGIVNDVIIFTDRGEKELFDFSDHCTENKYFPLLLHRVVEGWNEKQHGEDCIVISDDNLVLWREHLDFCKVFDFKDYKPCHLTACEMAVWDCLIQILKENS